LNASRIFPSLPRLSLVLLFAVLFLSACGGGPGDSWAGVSEDPNTDTIYVSFNQHITALNPTTGEVLWRYADKDKAKFYAVPVIDDGTLYVGDYKGKLHAINTETGEARWVYIPERDMLIGPISPTSTDRIIGGVAVDSDKVFFGLGSRNVMAISRETAKEVWTFETNHGVWAKPLYVPANPEDAASRATVYVVSLDHYLYALDAETGDLFWKIDLGGAAPGEMVYDAQRHWVYVGTFLSEMLAVDLSKHEIVDRFKADNWIWGGPALENDVLYFGDLAGNLYAVRIADAGFEQVWKKSLSKDPIRATPLLTEDMVIVGSKDKVVYAVNKADGAQTGSKKTRGEVLSNMALVPATETTPELVVVGTTQTDRLVVAYKINAIEAWDEIWHYADK
jgi:outer membrane protein assembly factor BamB